MTSGAEHGISLKHWGCFPGNSLPLLSSQLQCPLPILPIKPSLPPNPHPTTTQPLKACFLTSKPQKFPGARSRFPLSLIHIFVVPHPILVDLLPQWLYVDRKYQGEKIKSMGCSGPLLSLSTMTDLSQSLKKEEKLSKLELSYSNRHRQSRRIL